ncbi:MAG: YggS family pyridoxal phosphate-dependent enzyme [Acidobacteria bacterium]|nr:YggS family pyridoxal phosphate-dependent enzyme [Acidobacteriota bacterium]
MTLLDRIHGVEERIAKAAQACGRNRGEILLLAVTKVFPVDAMEEAYACGLREFGENYVQEFEGKHARAARLDGARFHLIGHLQSNKSRKAAELFHVVQTVDSVKLARRLAEAGFAGDVMIEVKLSEEQSKHGASIDELPALVDSIQALPALRLRGLMTMPPWSVDAEIARPYFRKLKALADVHGLHSLSMGMSNDLEVAVQEGSTIVRVGTALFGSRKPLL